MATIKMVITAIGTIGSNPAVGVDYSSVVPELVRPIKLVGDGLELNIGVSNRFWASLWLITPDDFFPASVGLTAFDSDVDGMPYKTQMFEFDMPSTVPFALDDYTHLEIDSPTVNGSSYLPGYFTDIAFWLYVDGVLVADSGNATVIGVFETNRGGGPFTVRTLRSNLAAMPEMFWTQLKRCIEEA